MQETISLEMLNFKSEFVLIYSVKNHFYVNNSQYASLDLSFHISMISGLIDKLLQFQKTHAISCSVKTLKIRKQNLYYLNG